MLANQIQLAFVTGTGVGDYRNYPSVVKERSSFGCLNMISCHAGDPAAINNKFPRHPLLHAAEANPQFLTGPSIKKVEHKRFCAWRNRSSFRQIFLAFIERKFQGMSMDVATFDRLIFGYESTICNPTKRSCFTWTEQSSPGDEETLLKKLVENYNPVFPEGDENWEELGGIYQSAS